MSKINSNMPQLKFMGLVESAITRYTNGGLLVGDLVKFIPKYSSSASYKGLGEAMRNVIDQFAVKAATTNLVVVNIKTQFPSRAPGNENNRGNVFSAEVALEIAPGYPDLQNKITVPGDLLEYVDVYPNLPPVSDDIRKQEKLTHKPAAVEKSDAFPDRSLPTKNVKI